MNRVKIYLFYNAIVALKALKCKFSWLMTTTGHIYIHTILCVFDLHVQITYEVNLFIHSHTSIHHLSMPWSSEELEARDLTWPTPDPRPLEFSHFIWRWTWRMFVELHHSKISWKLTETSGNCSVEIRQKNQEQLLLQDLSKKSGIGYWRIFKHHSTNTSH